MEATFDFAAELWEWDARDDASWVFVTLPLEVAEEIRDISDISRTVRGFGSVRVQVRIGGSEWRTSVFPDSRSGSYVLPVKKAVRRAEGLDIGSTANVELDVAIDAIG